MGLGKENTYWANRHTVVATGKYIYKQTITSCLLLH